MPIFAYTMMEPDSVRRYTVRYCSCQRLRLRRSPALPMPQISNEKDAPCLSGDQFAAEYELPGKFGIAGLVIYGGSNDGANPKRCVSLFTLFFR